jgi:large subunit ribosomal protein L25
MKTFDISLKKRGAKDADMLLAVLYGHGMEENYVCMTHKKDFIRLVKQNGRNIILNCKLEDDRTIPALIKDVQKDVISLDPIHLDLLAVSLEKEINTKAKVNLEGECIGIKNGGTLQQSTFVVELKGKPIDLPDVILVDISAMDMGTSVKAGDLPLGDSVSLITSESDLIFTIQAPKVEMIGEAAEETAAPESAEKVKEKAA